MNIDTKALRERLAEFNFISGQECGYNCGAEMKPATDGEYVLAEAAYERMNSAADLLAAIERLSETGTVQAFGALSDDDKLRWFVTTGQRDKWARDRIKDLEAENKRLLRAIRDATAVLDGETLEALNRAWGWCDDDVATRNLEHAVPWVKRAAALLREALAAGGEGC